MKIRHIFPLIAALFTLLFSPAASAQEAVTAQSPSAVAFASAPRAVFPLLDRNTRLDMIDYAVNGLDNPSANALGGRSVITSITPSSLGVRMSDSSTAQLALLGPDSVIMVISTVAAPGLDSNVAFYSTSWTPEQGSKRFSKPGWKDWIAPGGDLATVTSVIPFMLASYVYDPATLTLRITNNLSSFLDADTWSMVSSEMLPELVYRWNGSKFVMQK